MPNYNDRKTWVHSEVKCSFCGYTLLQNAEEMYYVCSNLACKYSGVIQ